jgi:hypothetical protein
MPVTLPRQKNNVHNQTNNVFLLGSALPNYVKSRYSATPIPVR